MAYFTPEELLKTRNVISSENQGAQFLAEDLEFRFLGEIPLIQSIREAEVSEDLRLYKKVLK